MHRYACIGTHMHILVPIRICECKDTYMRAYVHISIYIYIYIYIYILYASRYPTSPSMGSVLYEMACSATFQ